VKHRDGYVTGRNAMRYVIAAAAALAISLAAASPGRAQDRGSLQASFNACVEQAKQAGWSLQDLGENRPAARRYVIRCMQGSGAQARSKKR
jgi:hypothetical protein